MNKLRKNWITGVWAKRIKDMFLTLPNTLVIPLTWKKDCMNPRLEVNSLSINRDKVFPETLDKPQVVAVVM